MTTIRTFMTDDHRRCDEFFAEAEQAVGKKNIEAARASFGHFRTAVLAHFDSEEKTLFPTFEAKTGMTMGPTQVMRMEHQQMRDLMSQAQAAIDAGDTDEYMGQAETLLIMMQQHNMKEENMLYPMCEAHLARVQDELCTLLSQALAAEHTA